MAAQFLVALKAVPWGMILKNAPLIVTAAERLVRAVSRKKRPTAENDIMKLGERVSALEAHDQENADLVKDMAQQILGLTEVSQVLAARLRVVTLVGSAALLISIGLSVAAVSQ